MTIKNEPAITPRYCESCRKETKHVLAKQTATHVTYICGECGYPRPPEPKKETTK